MQTKISKSLLSNLLLKISLFPKPKVIENPIIQFSAFLSPHSHFSSIPNRPMRGENKRRDDNNKNANFNMSMRRERPKRDENSNDSFKISDIMKEKDTHFANLDFNDMGSKKNQSRDAKLDFDVLGMEKNEACDEKLDSDDMGSVEKKNKSIFESFNFSEISGDKNVTRTRKNSEKIVPPENADEIFKKMKETGLIPNAVAMLDGLCKDGLVQEAMKLFGLMREKGTIPEVVIYTAVVEGFCKAEKFDDAIRIFRKMQKNEIVPNAFSYGVIIQGLSKGKRLDDGVEFCFEMIDAGHLPNAASLVSLVSVFCEEKGVEEAEKLVRSLREKGYAIDDRKVREHLDKKGPYLPMVWEAIFGKRNAQRPVF